MKRVGKKCRTALLAAIVTIVLFRPPPAPANPRTSTDIELERYFDSDYNWCDVQLLSAYWDQDWGETKARIGRKIGWGDEPILEDYLSSARQLANDRGVRCSFYESEFTYEDAEVLAREWGVPIGEAKAIVEDKLFDGYAEIVRSTLAEASGRGAPSRQPDPIDFFWTKGYTFCDANLIATYWRQDIIETKAELGSKMLAGDWDGVDYIFGDARREVSDGRLRSFSCNYWDEGYTYDDMEALARFWRLSVEDTKATVEDKLLWGLNDVVQDALSQVGSRR